jgi:hypothetical protein
MKGELIGINGRIALGSQRKVNVGVGYAIPINAIKIFLPDMKKGKDVSHGVLGLSFSENLKITKILESSPAAEAGLKKGDRFISIDGQKPLDRYDLMHRINSHSAGTSLHLEVTRFVPGYGKRKKKTRHLDFNITLAARPLPLRLARKTSGIPFVQYDFTGIDPIVDMSLSRRERLAGVLERFRMVNADPAYRQDISNGLLRLHTIRFSDAQESRYKPQSLGLVTSDVISIFKGDRNMLVRIQNFSVNQQFSMSSFLGNSAWINGTRFGAGKYTKKKLESAAKTLARRRCLMEGKVLPEWKISLEKNTQLISGRRCFVLKTSLAGKKIQRHYVGVNSGVLLAEAWFDKDGKLLKMRHYKEFIRHEKKVLPRLWEDRSEDNVLLSQTRVTKMAYDLDLNSLLFTFQPSIYF